MNICGEPTENYFSPDPNLTLFKSTLLLKIMIVSIQIEYKWNFSVFMMTFYR